MSEAVLDASALLALLNAEPGAELVAELLPGASISAVNYSEVVAKLADAGMPGEIVDEALGGLGLDVVAFSREQGRAAGLLRPETRRAGLSLGDRACLAVALERQAPAYTTDSVWAELGLDLEIRVIR